MLEILDLFPKNISNQIFQSSNMNLKNLEEIRLRVQKPIILKFLDKEVVLDYIISQNEILNILQFMCDNSIYSYQNQICNGYITIRGGHRVGISGDVILEGGKVKNISYVYSLNFRIAKEINGASDNVIKYILDTDNNSVYNSLIVGPPNTR